MNRLNEGVFKWRTSVCPTHSHSTKIYFCENEQQLLELSGLTLIAKHRRELVFPHEGGLQSSAVCTAVRWVIDRHGRLHSSATGVTLTFTYSHSMSVGVCCAAECIASSLVLTLTNTRKGLNQIVPSCQEQCVPTARVAECVKALQARSRFWSMRFKKIVQVFCHVLEFNLFTLSRLQISGR